MDDDAGSAQAEALMTEMVGHAADIARKLEAAEMRNRRAQVLGLHRRDTSVGALRRELNEVHRLINGLRRRTFPDAIAANHLIHGHVSRHRR